MDVMQVVTYPASLPETPRFPSPTMAPFSSATGKGYQQDRWMDAWMPDFGRILLNWEVC